VLQDALFEHRLTAVDVVQLERAMCRDTVAVRVTSIASVRAESCTGAPGSRSDIARRKSGTVKTALTVFR